MHRDKQMYKKEVCVSVEEDYPFCDDDLSATVEKYDQFKLFK